jgi:hypothetical protein
MGRDNSNPKDANQAKPESKTVATEISIESDDAAEAQARQRAIGKELRRWYDNIVKEDVPDELLKLLRELDARKDK